MARLALTRSAAALARAIPCDLALASFAKARCLCRCRQLSGLFSDRGCAAELRSRPLSPYPCKSIHMATRNSTSTGVHARAMLGWNFCRRADTSCNCASLSSDSRRRACGEASAAPPARREYMSASTVDAAALAGASFISDHARSSETFSSSRRGARRISALTSWCVSTASLASARDDVHLVRAPPSAWTNPAALMELRLQVWPSCSAYCGAAAAWAAHHLPKSSTAARSGAPSPTAARRPNDRAHAIQTFDRLALRRASPWLRALLPSRGSPPRSGHRPSCDELNGR